MNGTPEHVVPTRDTHRRTVDPLLYPVPDVAEALGKISNRHVYKLMDTGELESITIGRRRMVVAESMRAYVDRLRQEQNARHHDAPATAA